MSSTSSSFFLTDNDPSRPCSQTPPPASFRTSNRPRRNTSSSFPFSLAFSDIDVEEDRNGAGLSTDVGNDGLGGLGTGSPGSGQGHVSSRQGRDRSLSSSTTLSTPLSCTSTPSLSTSIGSPASGYGFTTNTAEERSCAGEERYNGNELVVTPSDAPFWLGPALVVRQDGQRSAPTHATRDATGEEQTAGSSRAFAERRPGDPFDVVAGQYVRAGPSLWSNRYDDAEDDGDSARWTSSERRYGLPGAGGRDKGKGRAMDEVHLQSSGRAGSATWDDEVASSDEDEEVPPELSDTVVLTRPPQPDANESGALYPPEEMLLEKGTNIPATSNNTRLLSSGSTRPPTSALGQSIVRSRAQSIANTGSSSLISTRNPSPASSVYRDGQVGSRISGLRGKLQRSKGSFLGKMSGNDRQESDMESSGSRDETAKGQISYTSAPSKDKATDKGKVKGFVRKIMVRNKSSLSVPVSTPAMTIIPASPIEIMDGGELGTLRSGSRPRLRLVMMRPPYDLEHRTATFFPDDIDVLLDPAMDQATPSPVCLFNIMLPNELKVRILESLVELHEREHEDQVERGEWVGATAAETRWYGVSAGLREVITLGRVSRAWQDLSLSGQLWADVDMHGFLHHLSPMGLSRILRATCKYTTKLNLYGWRNLPMSAIEHALLGHGGDTGLQHIDIQGCLGFDTEGLHRLIRNSPHLRIARFKGSPAVTDVTIETLARTCTNLTELDVSHCREAAPISPQIFSIDGAWTRLRELRMSGLAGKGLLAQIGSSMPNLDVLDVSYSPNMTDDDLRDLVTVPGDWILRRAWRAEGPDQDRPMRYLRASIAGQDPATFDCNGLVPRRITKLRHISISNCTSLSHAACNYLAFAVPDLEVLEMANMRPGLKEAGLIALLTSCPKLRILDIEGADAVTDATLAALTPPKMSTEHKHIGQALERLSIGFATGVSNDALVRLVRSCPKLIQLNIDNTSAGDTLVKEFIRKARPGSAISVVDCRNVSRNVVEAMERYTRPRAGWRGWEAGPLDYQDGKHKGSPRDECAELPVVQSFWTWSKVPRATVVPSAHDSLADGSKSTSTERLGGTPADSDRQCVIM